MESYQCPDCLGVHEAATEAVVGIFVRCEACVLDGLLRSEFTSAERLVDELAQPEAA